MENPVKVQTMRYFKYAEGWRSPFSQQRKGRKSRDGGLCLFMFNCIYLTSSKIASNYNQSQINFIPTKHITHKDKYKITIFNKTITLTHKTRQHQ